MMGYFNYIMNGYGPMGWFGFGFGFIFMILFWGIIIWLIVALIRGLSKHNQPGVETKNKTPLEILKKRYAKGEIEKEEFEEKKRNLEK
jgi:putative membrane protein